MLSKQASIDLVGDWLPVWRKERSRLDALEDWHRGKNQEPYAPRRSSREYRQLRAKATSPYLTHVVKSVVQGLIVDGYRRADAPEDSAPWEIWQANGMDSRQVAIHRGAVALGCSYVTVLPGDPLPVARGVSARKMLAHYADACEDEWPMFALRVANSGNGFMIRLLDEEAEYFLGIETIGDAPMFIEARAHGLGVCPVVRFSAQLDLDGKSIGEVEPYIPIAARIDQTTLDRLIVQRYGSWKVRTVAGMAKPDTDEEEEAVKKILEVGDLLVSGSPDTKFGTLDETPLDGYILSKQSDVRELATLSQTPSGDLFANLAAEALAEARYGATMKQGEFKLTFGESHEQWLRLAGAANGDTEAAVDYESQVVWRDNESRSLAQNADALGKLAQMLGVPVEMLWEKIPGWTQTDVERAKAQAAANRDQQALAQAKSFGLTGSAAPVADNGTTGP